MLSLPSSPVPVALAALFLGGVATRLLGVTPGTATGWRLVGVRAVPAAATAAVAVVVWTTPVAVWLWGVGAVLAAAAVLSPLSDGLRVDGRLPRPDELERVGGVPCDPTDLRVVDAGGRVAGYAVGAPRTGRVAVSEFALATLSPRAVAALLAHERAHHDGWHLPLRAGASVATVAAGVALVAVSAPGPTAAAAGLVGVAVGERAVATAVARRLELAADARAARRTSPGAVVELLESRDAATGGRPWLPRQFSSHPSDRRRVARLRAMGEAGE